ncbi:MAG: globin-coupled sensor protein [Caulobacter sp.]|nr:globin-coupled sensor protein [Caulobacter sp.]
MSNDYSLNERLSFMDLDTQGRAALRALKPLIDREIGQALAAFYGKVKSTPETRRFFGDERHMDAAGARQKAHWGVIAEADYSQTYVQAVRKIGETHARIGLEPRWYIGGYALVTEHLVRAAIRERWPRGFMARGDGAEAAADGVAALVKAAMLDMDFAISIYLETIEAERQRLEAQRLATERDQNAVVSALGEALARVARGDLTARLDGPVGEEFEALRADFNNALSMLEQAMGQVAVATDGIRMGADEIGVAADDLSRRTEQQAANLEETAAALDQITATVRTTAAGAKQASTVIAAAKTDAEKSGAVVTEAVEAMGQIEASSREIGKILGVIDEIAFQTNLLALNAGVEAARAGDAGKGFAVVAQEVRALAQRSAEAAKEIETLISSSSRQIASGVTLVDRTGQALRGIVGKVAEIDDLITAIACSAQEQSTGLHQVNIAVNQMDTVTQQNAAMVEQTTAATHSLKGQSGDLVRLVGAFHLSGQVSSPPSGAARPRPDPAPVSRPGSAAPLRRVAGSAAPVADAGGWEEF